MPTIPSAGLRAAILAAAMAALAAAPAPLASQEIEPGANPDTRIFQIQYMNRSDLDQILRQVFGVTTYTFDDRTRTLLVRAPGSLLPGIAEVIERFDVPQPPTRGFDLTTYVLRASPGEARAVPDDLAPVVTQLEALFPGSGFGLIDTISARVVEGQVFSLQGGLSLAAGAGTDAPYALRGRLRLQDEPAGATLRIEDMYFTVDMPGADAQIATSIELAEGQYAVVGRTSLAGRGALILVMTARETD